MYDNVMTRIVQILAWTTLLLVALATLSPIGLRPRLPVAVDMERALAFALLGFLFATAYPRKIWFSIGVVLIGAFGLEIMQDMRFDRHGRIDDAVLKAVGGIVGVAAGWIVSRVGQLKRNR